MVFTKPLTEKYGLTDRPKKCKNNVSSIFGLVLQRPDVLHRRLRRRPGRLQQDGNSIGFFDRLKLGDPAQSIVSGPPNSLMLGMTWAIAQLWAV